MFLVRPTDYGLFQIRAVSVSGKQDTLSILRRRMYKSSCLLAVRLSCPSVRPKEYSQLPAACPMKIHPVCGHPAGICFPF